MKKETFSYAKRAGVPLLMDVYSPDDSDCQHPVIIHVHGGALCSGSRANDLQYSYCQSLAGLGYVVCCIDYRLAMKHLPETVPNIMRAVDTAVDDLVSATAFVLKHKDNWNINPDRVVLSGSGAGAMVALTAEYRLCNDELGNVPINFHYAAVVAFAGAVVTDINDLEWAVMPCPMLLIHGDCDQHVSFNKFDAPHMMWAGSHLLHCNLAETSTPHWFVEMKGADHIIAYESMSRFILDIDSFIKKMVDRKMQTIMYSIITDAVPSTLDDIGTIAPEYLSGWLDADDIDIVIKDYVK